MNSLADKLFEDLGYTKYDNHPDEELNNKWVTQDERVIEYTQSDVIKGVEYTMFIRFHLPITNNIVVEIGANERRDGYKELRRYRNPILNKEELKAISLKLEELENMKY